MKRMEKVSCFIISARNGILPHTRLNPSQVAEYLLICRYTPASILRESKNVCTP